MAVSLKCARIQGSGIRASDDRREMQSGEPKRGRHKGKVEVRALKEFHADPVYGGDLKRGRRLAKDEAGEW